MEMSIYQLAIDCKQFSDKHITCFCQIVANRKSYYVYGANKSYERLLLSLCEAISEKYPYISEKLKEHTLQYDKRTIVHQSAIDELVNFILYLEELRTSRKKIFISHSSWDKNIMEKFTDSILQLGIGLSYEDIFCTSIEEMGIKNGEDIRRHIKENVQVADFSFLMISKHYKESEICLNEMGAVWAADNRVRYYLLPDVDFKEIGWLCDTNKADMLGNSVALDALEEELTSFYGLPHKGGIWSRQRQNFVDYLASCKNEVEMMTEGFA